MDGVPCLKLARSIPSFSHMNCACEIRAFQQLGTELNQRTACEVQDFGASRASINMIPAAHHPLSDAGVGDHTNRQEKSNGYTLPG